MNRAIQSRSGNDLTLSGVRDRNKDSNTLLGGGYGGASAKMGEAQYLNFSSRGVSKYFFVF